MWIVCITSVRHVLTVNGYGGRQTKENEKSWCFKGWETLVTILKNYILNELRHRSLVFEKLYEMAQQVNDEDEDDFLTQFENGELGKFLRVAIDKLPPQKQKICLLKIEYGLSNQEIADRMGITVPTVKSHYTQAIKALRNEIESLIIWFPVIWINLIV